MASLVFTHDACIAHDPGPGHPERPARLEAVLEALRAPAFAALAWREAPPASPAQLARMHAPGHVARVLDAVPSRGHVHLDPDTAMSPASGEAALRAAGAVCAAIDAVLSGEAHNAFCAVRPPGHHAEADAAMGFCLFNNIAIGAAHARAVHGVERIAAIDFDVHHGNGTQHMFTADAALFFASSHQWPFYPGTGAADECGQGNIVNAPLAAGSGGAAFRAAFADTILPALDAFAPDLILISAGFDAHADDPLGGIALGADDFAWVTAEIRARAERACAGRIVSTLEGGYDLDALAESVQAHMGALIAP